MLQVSICRIDVHWVWIYLWDGWSRCTELFANGVVRLEDHQLQSNHDYSYQMSWSPSRPVWPYFLNESNLSWFDNVDILDRLTLLDKTVSVAECLMFEEEEHSLQDIVVEMTQYRCLFQDRYLFSHQSLLVLSNNSFIVSLVEHCKVAVFVTQNGCVSLGWFAFYESCLSKTEPFS